MYLSGQEYSVQLLSPQFTKDIERLKNIQRQVMKMVKGLESNLCDERLMELSLLSLRRAGSGITSSQYSST